MIRAIHLKNFKSFGRSARIPFAPVTVLSGLNNSGKSSILHSLLLLKQTDDIGGNFPLCPVGPYGSFGLYRDLAHSGSLRSIEIGFDLFLPRELPVEYARQFHKFRGQVKKGTRLSMLAKLRLNFQEDRTSECGFKLGRGSLNLSVDGIKDDPILVWNAHRLLQVKGLSMKQNFEGSSVHLSGFRPIHLERKGNEYGISPLPGIFDGALFRLSTNLGKIDFLGPLREDPHRYYVLDKEYYTTLGVRGENTWNALAHAPVKNVTFFDISSNRQRSMSLIDAVNWWLHYCGLADKITTKKRTGDPIYQVLLTGDFNGSRTIVDLGFGVSQVLPVLTMGLLGKYGSVLMFEQPEIHVHPAIQARLADFFLSLGKSGRQVIIETHSEHIINRIRTRILEKSLDPADISMLFLGKDSSHESIIEKIKFGSDGQIANWPKGFFDTQIDEIKAQNRALSARLRKLAK